MYIPFIGVSTAASSLQTGYRSPYLLITHKKCEDWNHLTYSPGLGLCAWDFLCAVSCIKQELESITPIKPIPSCQWTLHDKITNLTSRIWQLKIWWFGFVKLAIIIAEHLIASLRLLHDDILWRLMALDLLILHGVHRKMFILLVFRVLCTLLL